ncbi:MAG: DNA polymerase/3'-5' exonuclease PolX [Chitinophagaceae bacterium]|nr:DNA polymerase/3'-5' exonuclease PolX [Chitinophagaceae bacterium]
MTNAQIAEQFSLLSKLMELHGENSFRTKNYSTAAFNIDKLPVQFTDLEPEKIFSIKGIGESTGKKILEIIKTGRIKALEDLALKTPPGVLEMLSIKGIGPKKIATIWKKMEIESPGELLYACNENRLARYSGFGQKSQETIQNAVAFYLQHQGSHLFAQIEEYALQLDKILKKAFPGEKFEATGQVRMHSLIIEKLQWVTTVPTKKLRDFFRKHKFTEEEILTGSSFFRTPENVLLEFYPRTGDLFYPTLFETSASEQFLEEWNKEKNSRSTFKSEEDIFKSRGLHVIPPFLREKASVIARAKKDSFSNLIQPSDIRAIIHCHSDWSDGSNTIEQLAKACIKKGYEYMVISDHSKSAGYANGLSEERLKHQHLYVDELNDKLAPFRIFKGIESDILGDGSLDYSDRILSTFDVVIASVHSNVKMQEEKATARLLKAIQNPYTTILGHMTARLLLSRPGFPVDFKKIIAACAENNVVIEINANPRRLDMDWYWVDYALDKGVMVSINPDAHDIDEFDHCRYGVLAAQKGGVKKENNLSSFSLKQFEKFLLH